MLCTGCTEQTQARKSSKGVRRQVRLASDCASESSTLPATMARTVGRLGASFNERERRKAFERTSSVSWTSSISLAGLTAGQSYRLCSDLDGGSELPWGDTSFTVYVSPIISSLAKLGKGRPTCVAKVCWTTRSWDFVEFCWLQTEDSAQHLDEPHHDLSPWPL